MYDILLKNADIYDGSGKPAYRSDILIKDGVIVKIGNVDNDEWVLHKIRCFRPDREPRFHRSHTTMTILFSMISR